VREVFLKMSISLDGFVGGPDGELDWSFPTMDDDAISWMNETLLSRAGVHIMGRRTFHDMAAYYPTSTAPYAPAMNDIPKLFFSRTGRPSTKSTRPATVPAAQASTAAPSLHTTRSWDDAGGITGELAHEITRLKQQPGSFILAHGGASFANSLVRHDLIDEFHLLVHPVALGRGLSIFTGVDRPLELHLIRTKRFRAGAVALTYRRHI
jgi:dihydrofolate reductase